MDSRYEGWLRLTLDQRTIDSRLSNLRRIESAYGDLDELYDKGGFASLQQELTYSSKDARFNRPNLSRIEIAGDIRNGLATLKSAIQKYALFRQQAAREVAPETLDVSDAQSESDYREDGMAFSMERDLQTAVRRSISQLEDGLAVVDGGQEKTVPSGRIDILARDPQGRAVVIELKAVKAPRDAVAQLLAYMGDMQDAGEVGVRGVLVAPDFDARAVAAARVVPSIKLVRYGFTFSFSPLA